MARQTWFTRDGNVVIFEDGDGDRPSRLGVSVAALERGEMLRIAEWLLTQALPDGERRLVLAAIRGTGTWKRETAERLQDMADEARADA